jgi:alpha-2-macroglobulin
MINKFSALIASLLLISLIACNRNPKNMVSFVKNFTETVQTQQNLIFTFSHDIVNEDEVGKWDSTEYIKLSPKVEGRYRWSSPRELVFSPAKGFKPSADYTAEFTGKVFSKATNGKLFLGKEYKTIKFHTEYLKPEALNTFWAKSKDGNGIVIRLGISFNYEVDPAQLKSLMKVNIAGKEVPFSPDNTSPAKEVFFTVNGAAYGKEQALVVAKFAKGIKIHNGDYTTTDATELSQLLASRFDLVINGVESGFKDNKGFIRINTSQEIDATTLDKAFSISPHVANKPEITENGLLITGDFLINNAYTLTLLKEYFKGALGGVLKQNVSEEVFFGEMPPSIGFTSKKAIYLSKAGSRNVGINIVNVPEVQVKIIKIYQNNILAYMRGNDYGYYDYYDYDEGYNTPTYSLDNDGRYSSVVLERTIKTSDLPRVNGVATLNLDMPQIDEFKGIYVVQVSSKTDYYLNASKLVSISDIGIISKISENDLFIYTNSILTAKPMGGVELHIISTNNQDALQVKTDSKGVVVIKDFKEKMRHFSPAMLTAKLDDDFNYMLLSSTGVETSRFDVGGKREHPSGIDVFIYGDRNLYRPGEKVYFNAIARNNKWEPMGDIPMKVKILMPNGKEYASFRKNTNNQGAIDGSFEISTSAVTGNYTIEVYNGNDMLLASEGINIEEFMPDRIKSTLTLNKPSYQISDKVTASIEAVNYFGPPAANRNFELELMFNRKNFNPKNYTDYNFYISTSQYFNATLREGQTDLAGKASETFEIDAAYKDMGVLEGIMYATVFDESGRPVNRSKRFDIFTQPVMYGIKIEDYYLKTNEAMQAKLVAVDKDGKPVNSKAIVKVVQHEWQSVLTRGYNDNYYYTSKKVEKLVETRTVSFTRGEAVFTYVPPISGSYEIRVLRDGAQRYVSQSFYAYRWGTTLATSFDVNTEGSIDIVFDKEKYDVGDKAKVLFKTPFAGKLLVTMERNGIFDYRVIETDKKSAEIEIPVKDEFLPNIYISATLIKPLTNSGIPLMVAHGYSNLKVEKKSTVLPVEITAVEKSRSSTKQKITVKTKAEAGIQVTLAVVDEGILALKNFSTPDPHGHFYARRALEVSSYDLYPYLFPEINEKSSSGGDGYDLGKRVNPLSNSRVKLVAFWSGILTTNGNGEVTYEVDLPKFSGDLRIMAVAYKNGNFGSADKHMKVADPLVVSTGLPRFFSPGDEIVMPVNISNTTAKNANAKINVTISGPVQTTNGNSESVTITANKENLVVFKLKALPQIGNAKIKVAVTGLGETFTDETDITVRPSTSLLKTSLSGTMKPGESKELELNPDYIPSSIATKLVISKNPMTEFVDRFSYLVGYPHGCVEQTVSKAFPQLYFADFIKGSSIKQPLQISNADNDLNPEFNVREAIRKLQGMQLYNGGMSYWPGGYDESWWGSVYAAHFLIEAKNAGYDVDNKVITRLVDYLTYKSDNKELKEYRYYDNLSGAYTVKKYAPREVIYSLYILSRAGKPNRSLMNYYKGNKEVLTDDERYLLAAAFAFTSDKVSFADVLPKDYVEHDPTKSTGGSFYSPIRNLAIALHALIESDVNNRQIPAMMRNLTTQLRNSRYHSTQELSFAFLAMGKMAQQANKADVSAIVRANNKIVGNFSNKDLVLDANKLGNQKISITVSGTGQLYYYYEMEGISSTGKYEEVDNFLRVRKEFFNRYGQRINGTTFKQNDLIVVRISIASLNNMDIDNVVVTDMLPAGFEIENPRVTEGRDFDWTTNRAYTQHFDVRDDRINFYLDPSNNEQFIYYTVRAVTRGKFIMGPVGADAMYNGEYRSYNGAGTITVE